VEPSAAVESSVAVAAPYVAASTVGSSGRIVVSRASLARQAQQAGPLMKTPTRAHWTHPSGIGNNLKTVHRRKCNHCFNQRTIGPQKKKIVSLPKLFCLDSFI
jgi:hypothetical protein